VSSQLIPSLVEVGNIGLADSNDGNIALKIVEQLCKFFCELTGHRLPGNTVLLRIDESGHPELMNTIIEGTIYDIKSGFMTNGPNGSQWLDDIYAIIRVDSVLIINGQNVKWLITIPRHTGYGLYRLYFTSIAVYIHILDRPSLPHDLLWDDVSAVCIMKLKKVE
jgi:hypothetical protein